MLRLLLLEWRDFMGRPLVDIKGQKFRRLTAIHLDHMQGKRAYWKFKCACGNELVARADAVKFGKIHSCGCYQEELRQNGHPSKTHGMSYSVIYDRWQGMIDRCYRSHDKSFESYGGRGIKVCDEWLNSFLSFYEWSIANGYSEYLTLDRQDVNGNYDPGNCRYVSMKEQNRNKRTNVLLTIGSETKCVTDWCEDFNFPRHVVYRRLKKNPHATNNELFAPVKQYRRVG